MKTMTPIPPTQCVKLRQKRPVWLRASTLVRILDPVVVKPETVSNKASVKFGISPVITSGTAPRILMTIQLMPTITRPSLA